LPVSPGKGLGHAQKFAATGFTHIINQTVGRGRNWATFIDNELAGLNIFDPT